VWVLAGFIVGMFLAWYKISIAYVLLLALSGYVLQYLLIFRIQTLYISRRDSFLWCLPLLLLLGYYTMGAQMARPALDRAFDEKARCELSGRITMIVEKQWGRALYVTDNTIHLSGRDPFRCENIIVNCSDHQTYLVGNQITVFGEIQKFSEAANPGQFNEKLYYEIENIDYKMKADQIQITDSSYSKFHAVINRIKQRLIHVYSNILNKKESGALIAMLLGEKFLLEEEIKELYQENGISHILAISGLHIMLIGMFLYQLLRKLRIPLIPATIVTILFIYSYGVLTNFSVSTNRAVVMMVILLLAAIFGKTYDMLSATALSAFLILMQNPLQIFSAGFLLSFGAVLGIALMMPCLSSLFPSQNVISNSLNVSISAQLMTMPVLLNFFYQYPIYNLFINLLVLPFTSFLVLSAIIAGIAGVIYLPFGVFCIGGTNYVLIFYEGVCKIGSSLPGNRITTGQPEGLRMLLYLSLLGVFLWGVKRYQKKRLLLVLILAVMILFFPRQNTGLEITMLDVGQGDGIFMKTERNTTYFIDGGSTDIKKVGTYRIQPFLLSSGVDVIDYAIVSHSDNDHISGLKELFVDDKISIRNLLLPNTSFKDEAFLELEQLAVERGANVQYIKEGDRITDGNIQITCLHPTPEFIPQSNNAYSTVLSINYGDFDMLLTGDLELNGEEAVTELLTEYAIGASNSITTDYDILKVAHHGSKNSTLEDFLQIVRPEIALISCGKDNSYGHPHKELIERLEQMKSKIKITTEGGAITIKTDGKKVEVREYKKWD
jgi:competence protein ComEC